MQCVSCDGEMTEAGGVARCACGGAWVSEANLVDMAVEVKGALVALPWDHRKGDPRPCPVCAARMQTVALVRVALDRCAAHGVWFDANELADVLQRAGKLPDELPPGWEPADDAKVAPVASPTEHADIRKLSDRIGLGIFLALEGLLKSMNDRRGW